MPTGYTQSIQDGISFERFALTCARAFGACIMMRDDPLDAPIPEKFEPNNYYERLWLRDEVRLQEILALTDEQAQAAAEEEAAKTVAQYQKMIDEALQQKDKYVAMLEKVQAWEPPTPEHQPLKDFMISQINDSLKWDCNDDRIASYQEFIDELKIMNGAEWKTRQIMYLTDSIAQYKEKQRQENERTASRSEWVAQLRASLVVPTEKVES
jgi:hypothetical protein